MIPTPTSSDHIERASTSTEKLNPLTGKSVSLDRFVKFWPDEETQKSGKPKMWATPQAHDGMAGPRSEASALKKGSRCLQREVKMWPTPQARDGDQRGAQAKRYLNPERSNDLPDAVALYPTARSKHLCGGTGNFEQLNKLKDAGQITEPERRAMAGGGSLNPTWVEWLMGYPPEWTALNASATPSSHRSSSGSDTPSSKRKG